MAYTGDVPADTSLPPNCGLFRNAANDGWMAAPIDRRSFNIGVGSPASGTQVVFSYIYEGITITGLDAVIPDGTSAEVFVKYQSVPYTAGIAVASGVATISGVYTSANVSVAAGNWLSVTVGAVSGSITALTVIVTGYVT